MGGVPDRLGVFLLPKERVIVVSAEQSGAVQFFLMLFLRSNSQIIDTAEGNLSAGQFIGVDIDSRII